MTNLVVGAAVGGAAGGFIKELSSNGVKWLIDLVSAQSPEMQAAAKKNMENFVNRLARRVERLENDIPIEQSKVFKSALNHPGTALLIKTAIVDAATTENEEKHELLSELIAQRLTAGADDMIALTGSAACSVVNSLTSRQIRVLAVLAVAQSIRPLQKVNVDTTEKQVEYVDQWWTMNLIPLLEDGILDNCNNLDFEHLVAMGCLRLSIGSSSITDVAVSNFFNEDPSSISSQGFEGKIWFDKLSSQWQYLGHAILTSVGQLIGVLHRDSKLKTNTRINWD